MFEEPVSEEPVVDDAVFASRSTDQTAATITGWSIPALVIGAAVVAIAISGLLDDSGLAPHPYWVVPAVCLFAACAAVGARTVRRLVTA